MIDAEVLAGLSRRRDHRIGLRGGQRHGLLNQHVDAGREQLHGQAGVRGGRRDHMHHIRLRRTQQFIDIGVGRHLPACRQLLAAVATEVARSCQFHLRNLAEVAAVDMSDAPATEQCNPDTRGSGHREERQSRDSGVSALPAVALQLLDVVIDLVGIVADFSCLQHRAHFPDGIVDVPYRDEAQLFTDPVEGHAITTAILDVIEVLDDGSRDLLGTPCRRFGRP